LPLIVELTSTSEPVLSTRIGLLLFCVSSLPFRCNVPKTSKPEAERSTTRTEMLFAVSVPPARMSKTSFGHAPVQSEAGLTFAPEMTVGAPVDGPLNVTFAPITTGADGAKKPPEKLSTSPLTKAPAATWSSCVALVMETVAACVRVIVIVNDAVLVCPEVLVAEQLTVVAPFGNCVPDVWSHVTGAVPSFRSVAVTLNVSTFPNGLVDVSVMLFAPTIVGAVSLTVTVNDLLELLFAGSLALQFTVVVPNGNVEPEAGEHTSVRLACKSSGSV